MASALSGALLNTAFLSFSLENSDQLTPSLAFRDHHCRTLDSSIYSAFSYWTWLLESVHPYIQFKLVY